MKKVKNPKVFSQKEFNEIVEARLTISEICIKYNLGNYNHKIWYNSLNKYGSEKWKSLEGERRSRRMMGNKNGCRPPTNLPNKPDLEDMIDAGETQLDIRKHFKGGERLFHRWIEYHGLGKKWNDSKQTRLPYNWLNDEIAINCINLIDPNILDTIKSLPDKDMIIRLRKVQRALLFYARHIADLNRLMMTRSGVKGVSQSTNVGEMVIEEALEAKGINYERNRLIKKYTLDFYLPAYDLFIEVDGSIHNLGPSKDRDIILDNILGDRLFRIRSRKKGQKLFEDSNEDLTNLFKKLGI